MLKKTAAERGLLIAIYTILTLFSLSCVLPFIYVLTVSITPINEVIQRGIVLFPINPTISAYREILSGGIMMNAYRVTLYVTIVGTLLNLCFTALTAYPLARKGLPYRNVLMIGIVFTMIFNGGMIPNFLLVKSLGLMDTLWALMIPGLISAFYLIIMKSFFEQLPEELFESSRMDGANEWYILLRIVIPLSLPVIASLGLFFAVNHWNSFFDGILYINNSRKFPLQVVLRGILLGATNVSADSLPDDSRAVSPLTIQMAAVIVTIVPILCVYPFIQKHFAKGMLLGSIKG